jgi:acyl-CoA synthetase (AMP-forming)/AMP-acid ligase II
MTPSRFLPARNPWRESQAEAWRTSGAWAGKTIAHFAEERVAREPGRVLLVDGGRKFTCAQLHSQARTLASALLRRGLVPGDVVSFQLPNWHEAHVLNLAAAMAGLVIHPIGTINRHAEVAYMLRNCGSRIVFTAESFRGFAHAAMFDQLRREGLGVDLVVVRGDANSPASHESLMASGDAGSALPEVDAGSVKLVMYTSGTTGRPKGVIHTHESLHAENVQRRKYLELTGDDCFLVPSPVAHVTGTLYGLNMPWNCGTTAVLLDRWDPDEAFVAARDNRCTVVNGAPFLQGLVEAAKRFGETLPCLRYFSLGGTAISPDLIRAAGEVFANCIVFRAYGSTEVPTLTPGLADSAFRKQGLETDGNIGDCELRVVDMDSGADLPEGAEGEIIARGPQMLLGYTDAEDNAGAFTGDGFFRMGDIGRITEGRFVTITGRKKDLIIRKGENLSPKEIEDVVFTHPAVADVAVVAMPSDATGELACAFVVLRPSHSLALADLARHVTAAGLARQKIPERLEIVDGFPRNAYGKVRKDLLRQLAREIAQRAKMER